MHHGQVSQFQMSYIQSQCCFLTHVGSYFAILTADRRHEKAAGFSFYEQSEDFVLIKDIYRNHF